MKLSDQDKRRLMEYLAIYGAYQIPRSLINRALSGRVTKAENQLFKALMRPVARAVGAGIVRAPGTAAAVGVGAARLAGTVAMRHPLLTTVGVLYVAHQNQDEIRQLMQQGYEILQQPQFSMGDPGEFGQIRPGPIMATIPTETLKRIGHTRALSKANRAVREAMKMLKAGTKAQTGSKPGTLAKGAFKLATKAAGLANPKTKSRIGKAKTKLNKLARRIKKWW
jgi:hypothetical protein